MFRSAKNLTPLDFATELNAMQAKTRISWYRMSDFSGIDRAYLSRLKNGQATNPSVNTVFRLSYSLTKDGAERYDLDRLLISAGYHPVFEIT